jgi:lipopolysaccharide export system protein LptA
MIQRTLRPILTAILFIIFISANASSDNDAPGQNQSKADRTQTAASETPAKEKTDKNPIAIESDKAVINRTEHIIELEGNVKVSQGDTVITSNALKLFLKEGASIDAPQKGQESAIEKITAKGNVIFKLDIGTAYSDQAEYSTHTRQLVLTGKEPKFVSGENTITGSKITVNRDSGMVTFEGGGKSRVEAIIHSKEQL